VRLLLDTHVALWAVTDSPLLSSKARDLIAAPSNEITVSVVSVWEITIKFALGRTGIGSMPVSGEQALRAFRLADYNMLSVHEEHVLALAALPPIHRDPFDRMLIAQSAAETLQLLTHDKHVAAYSGGILHI
jgi:PIN domain nuclease of toxin-antitoxin system